jgi:hypothetical protein
MKARVYMILLPLISLPLLPYVSWGQASGGGSISGLITDSTGSLVPNAVVAVTNKATGVVTTTAGNPTGRFIFPVLSAGAYTLKVTKTGFSTATADDVIVSLSQTTSETITLQVGGENSTVEVSANSAGLNTSTLETTTGLDQATYASLPVPNTGSARSIVAVATLAPGVYVNAATGNNNGSTPRSTLVVSGGQGYSGQSQIDGVTYLTSNTSSDFFGFQPVPLEALSEFTLVQNNYSANYGRTPGGVLSFNTRSGTNGWHGEVYEFNENTDMNARSYFAATRTATVQNEFGANLGGPIIKDKAFFFVYYGGYRFSGASPAAATTIETPAELSGDFSSYVNASGQVVPIYDPNTTLCNAAGVCTRQQFPGNKIPAARIGQVAKSFFPYIPTPTNNNETANFVYSAGNTNVATQYGGKIDYTLREHDTLHGFFGAQPFTSGADIGPPNEFPFNQSATELPDNAMVLILSEDHTFSPTLLNHFAFGFSRTNESYVRPGYNAPVSLGIGNIVPSPPLLYFTEYPGVGTVGQFIASNGFDYNDFVSLTRRNHELQVGGEFQRIQGNTQSISAASFNFSDLETGQPGIPATGNSFASFLLGNVDSASEAYTFVPIGTRYSYMALYVQDNWKLRPNLTVNLGVRYEIPFTRTQTHNTLASFDPSMSNPGAGGLPGALAFAGSGAAPYCNCQRFSEINYSGVQPRIGFAYSLDKNIVIRGNFGMFEGTTGDTLDNGWRTNFSDGTNASPSFASPNLGVTPAFNINDGFPAFQKPPQVSATLDNGGNISYIAKRNGTTARISLWNFDVQNALPGGFLLDLGYVGNSGHHLGSALANPNQDNPNYLALGATLDDLLSSAAGQASGVPVPYPGFSGTVAQALRPYPQYLTVEELAQNEANSSYNALQAKLQRRISRGGPMILVSYTWAKLLADSDYAGPTGAGLVSGGQNSFNPRSERGLSTLQPPQIASISYVWQLPFGQGERYLHTRSLASALFGGWEITGVQSYHSGEPFVVDIPNTLPIFNSILRPNRVLGVPLKGYQGNFNPATDVYLNGAAFSIPAPYTFGDVRRTVDGIRSFAYYDEDLGVGRNIHLSEGITLFLQANAFNAFNRVVFGSPDTSDFGTNADFGHITSQGNSPRLLQLQAKVSF